mmetsp:Transcript_7806/g.11314  ORF Transcript_7806/g.11314 Transcript_7806/m.11314 type:complete len:665 (-) Transcript_7806:243-2237(-)
MGTEEQLEPRWCSKQQIYLNGRVPRAESAPDVSSLLNLCDDNNKCLRIFGYGSLCWNPGTGVLSKPEVTRTLGRAVGWRRCWAQRSADHRGTPSFPGIVCTLLKDEEVQLLKGECERGSVSTATQHNSNESTAISSTKTSMTKGLIYTIPVSLVDECLAELDFREKGGYSRDVIDVLDDSSGKIIKALLYRGTPDNPAFWRRALFDLSFAAAVMATAVGPSGKNDEYLFMLDSFLSTSSRRLHLDDSDHTGDLDTKTLATLTRELQQHSDLLYLYGAGSNQHGQLLLRHKQIPLVNGDEVHEFAEVVLAVPKENGSAKVRSIHAGGGHSALVTNIGTCYLWGWNEFNQLGRLDDKCSDDEDFLLLQPVQPLQNLKVDQVALGYDHSLVIEKDTGHVYAFGNNGRGQSGQKHETSKVVTPTVPINLKGVRCIYVATGLFHSAAIAEDGTLTTFGCSRFSQCLHEELNGWHPDDARLVKVSCGRRHTMALDEYGRVWTFGENRHGQLGRHGSQTAGAPGLVDHPLLREKGNGCFHIDCGWSHNIALVKEKESDVDDFQVRVFGWGRNDRGQLGVGTTESPIFQPRVIHESNQDKNFIQVYCGAESLIAIGSDGSIWSCGWNEHGNLALNHTHDAISLAKVTGATEGKSCTKRCVAMGGAHTFVIDL